MILFSTFGANLLSNLQSQWSRTGEKRKKICIKTYIVEKVKHK